MNKGCSGCFLILMGFILGVLAVVMVLSVVSTVSDEESVAEGTAVEVIQVPKAVQEPIAVTQPQASEPTKSVSKKVKEREKPKAQENEVEIVKVNPLEQPEGALATGVGLKEDPIVKPAKAKPAVQAESNTTSEPRQGGFNVKRRDGKNVTLYLGMSKAEIIGLLGEPESFRTMSYINGEELDYITGNNKYSGSVSDLTLRLKNGKLTDITKR